MTVSILDPSKVSVQEILTQLQDEVQSRPESEGWSDFLVPGAGTTLLELIAGLGSFYKYNIIAARRETSLQHARLPSSIYAILDILGYPINRSESARLTLKVNVTGNSYFQDRTVSIGEVGGVPISLVSSYRFTPGIHEEVGVVLGEWETFTQISDTNEPFAEINVYDSNVSSICNRYISLTVNGTDVPLTRYTEELPDFNGSEPKVLVKTAGDRLSLIFGTANIGYRLLIGDVVVLKYVRVSQEPTLGLDPTLFNLTLPETSFVDVSVVRNYSAEDDLRKLTVVGPGYFSARRKMINHADHEYMAMSYVGIRGAKVNPGLCSVNPDDNLTKVACREAGGEWERPYECCTTEIAYLYDDEHLMLSTEQDSLLEYLDPFRIQAEALVFKDSQRIWLDVSMVVVVQEGADIQQLNPVIEEVIADFTFTLGGYFHVPSLISSIAQISGVVRSYLEYPIIDRRLKYYQYFKLRDLQLNITTDQGTLSSYGTDINLGYEVDDEEVEICYQGATDDSPRTYTIPRTEWSSYSDRGAELGACST